jgi:hypothetical protein
MIFGLVYLLSQLFRYKRFLLPIKILNVLFYWFFVFFNRDLADDFISAYKIQVSRNFIDY